jgi:hypothetical protein
MDMIDQYDRSVTMKATALTTMSPADLAGFFRSVNTNSEPLMNAGEAAPFIDQMIARGDVTVVRSPLDNRTLGHVVVLGEWALFVTSELVAAGSGLRISADFRIRACRKSVRRFTALLVRWGQERPIYAGTDFTFRNLR